MYSKMYSQNPHDILFVLKIQDSTAYLNQFSVVSFIKES